MKTRVCVLVISLFSTTVGVAQTACVSSEERRLYDLIMQYRKSKKLKAIPYSEKLTRVAQTHVRDLAQHYDYENRGDTTLHKEVCNPHSWSDKGSWTACCYTDDHKRAQCMWDKPREIAGYEGEGYEIAYYSSEEASAIQGLEGWKASKGHNPLLVNSGMWQKMEWKAIGVGIHKQYAVVWFGALEDKSKLTECKN